MNGHGDVGPYSGLMPEPHPLEKIIDSTAQPRSRQIGYVQEEVWLDNPDEIADAVIAYLWERAADPAVVEAVQNAMDGPVLSWSTSDLKPGTAGQIAAALLTTLIGPKPEETT